MKIYAIVKKNVEIIDDLNNNESIFCKSLEEAKEYFDEGCVSEDLDVLDNEEYDIVELNIGKKYYIELSKKVKVVKKF